MALADSRWSQEQDVIAAVHVAAGREFADLFGVDGGLELEVEALQGFLEREAGHRDPHLMVLLGLRADLGGEQVVEEVGVGDFLFRRLLQARGKFVLDLVEPQPMAVLAQTFELRGAHRTLPPSLWLTAS